MSRKKLSLGLQLYKACWDGDLEAAQQVVRKGVRADWASKAGRTAFFGACSEGHLHVVQWLLEAVPESRGRRRRMVAKADAVGWVPFYAACWGGHLEVLQWLYRSVPDCRESVSHVDRRGQTPFLAACERGHLDVLRWLHECVPESRACVALPNAQGSTPFAMIYRLGCRGRLVSARGVAVWLASLPEVRPDLRRLDKVREVEATSDQHIQLWHEVEPWVTRANDLRALDLAQLVRQVHWEAQRERRRDTASAADGVDRHNLSDSSADVSSGKAARCLQLEHLMRQVVGRMGQPVFDQVLSMLAPPPLSIA